MPRSLSSPDGSLTRLEEQEAWRRSKEESEEKKGPQDLGQPLKCEQGEPSHKADLPPPPKPKPTLDELG